MNGCSDELPNTPFYGEIILQGDVDYLICYVLMSSENAISGKRNGRFVSEWGQDVGAKLGSRHFQRGGQGL